MAFNLKVGSADTSENDLLKPLLQSISLGIAVAEPESWAIVFENGKFFQWFAPDGEPDATLDMRLRDLKVDRARDRLARGRPYRYETEVKSGARAVSVAIEIREATFDGRDVVIAECRDVTDQKKSEFMLDSYSKMVERNTREIEKEKERVEKLLLNIMPRSVYEEMKDFGTATPQKFDAASIMMVDFVGFTDMAISRDPSALIAELNDMFSAFDRIVELFGCERIKTTGDAYMAVSGLPETNPDHAENIAKVALRVRRYLERRNASHPEQWICRIGINTGPVIGSLVGIQKYVYDIFGPGVNLAARMEAMAEPMQIVLCEESYRLIEDGFVCTDLGEAEIKGFGTLRLYSLDQEIKDRR